METTTEKKSESNRLHWGNARMTFLAQQEQIKSMLKQGYPQIAIHKTLLDHLNGMSYCQFSHLIRKNITGVIQTHTSKPPAVGSASNIESPKKKIASTTAFRGFVPGPKVPDLNELF
jgi:hypothetical protein